MPAQVLDGKALAKSIRDDLKRRTAALIGHGIRPRIEAVVAVQDPASMAYVAMKRKWAGWCGIESGEWPVTANTTQQEVLERVASLNQDPAVHGVLIQHPLPGHIDEAAVLESLGPEKDVDGITPQSLGRLTAGLPGFRCATPLGILKLLDHYGLDPKGKRAVVLGRSVILGKPAALMLLERHATVTICHSRTLDLPDLVRTADLLVAAIGKPEFVLGDWIKPGAIVVDAGYNKVSGRERDVGDCEAVGCAARASWITPVPGGVGPMTVASLLANTVEAAEKLVHA